MALLTLLAPLVVELLKIFFGKDKSAQEAAGKEIREALRKIRLAVDKAKETDDTSDIEDIINKR